jgi:putative membrane protein insertion efficiency factor
MDVFEFNVDEKLRPSVERKLTGTTKIDSKIALLPIEGNPVGIKISIFFLRTYRMFAPKAVRCRCVFDPSCSHYSELAFRQYGVFKGLRLTINRLVRCKPGYGGVDFYDLEQEGRNEL